MKDKATLQAKAKEALKYFKLHEKSEDNTIIITTDDCPEWVHDMVKSAHGDMFPDDFIYSTIYNVLNTIVDAVDEDEEFIEQLIIELEPTPYTSELTAWLASNNGRMDYLDEAMEVISNENTTAFDLLHLAQGLEIQAIGTSVLDSLRVSSSMKPETQSEIETQEQIKD